MIPSMGSNAFRMGADHAWFDGLNDAGMAPQKAVVRGTLMGH